LFVRGHVTPSRYINSLIYYEYDVILLGVTFYRYPYPYIILYLIIICLNRKINRL